MNTTHRWIVLAAIPLLLGAPGCSDDPVSPNDGDPGSSDDLPFAGSPAQLMQNFETAYEGRNLNGYVDMLDEDFLCFLKQETVSYFGLHRSYFDREEEVGITEVMFSGNPPCECVGAISDIDIVTLRQIDTWETTENTEFPGALESQFDVDFRVMQSTNAGERQINIKGRLIFFLSTEQVEHQGATRTLYHLTGMIDETDAAAKAGVVPTEDVSWGSLKALYRPQGESR